MGESLVRLQVAAGDERRRKFHAISQAIAEDQAVVEDQARMLLRAEREGWTPLLQRNIREDLAKAVNRLDVMRAELLRLQDPPRTGEALPPDWGKHCGPQCWGCSNRIGGVHRGRTP